MFKVDDIVVCKNFPRNVNGVYRDKDPNIIIDNSYKIVEIKNQLLKEVKWDLQMLRIIGEEGLCWYWSDYFYNKLEVRKIKLNKICSKLETR